MSEYINNATRRKETLKGLIRDLHAGGDVDEIRERFGRLLRDVSAVEIAQMEQELIDEGLPAEDIKALCDVHVAVFQQSLDAQEVPEMTPGHPVHTFKYENFAAGEVLTLLEAAVRDLPSENGWTRAQMHLEQLAELDKTYRRKENLLFPYLERHGVSGPSSVMWGIHDDIRAQFKTLRRAIDERDQTQVAEVLPSMAEAIRQMFYKEENILYPTALRVLSDAEWVAIRDQSDEIGYCLIRPGDQWQPAVAATSVADVAGAETAAPAVLAAGAQLPLDTGTLTPEQVNLVLKHLPIDVTFIDETDSVRYYSQGPDRIFDRTPAIIGRSVQNCHPPQSVHVVNELLEAFRSGERSSAEFWIQMAGKFVLIRYYAVRDEEGRYRGTIEVTQDIAPLRALEGERRLLDEALK
ncbi:MAG TPA: DUF438 domain-containing protein [Chloroflexi bacterium]|jgi:DUF438 domain-containing protein|nr:DUF438 domain-containing protein [Chloroflexota bacterium]